MRKKIWHIYGAFTIVLYCLSAWDEWGAMQTCGAPPSPRQPRRDMTTSCHLPLRLLTWAPPSRAEPLPLTMSSHKRSFQCFNAVGGEGSHQSGTRLPRIPQHGSVAHHEPLEVCCLCSEYRHAQALEALETQVLPLYQTHSLHHHHAHRCVLGRPTRPDEAHSGHGRHVYHHRYNKRLILVKNSDPSVRKTIVLHHRSIRSFGLFLEEVSELMQYHIRKLYTQEGHKVRSCTPGTSNAI